MIMESSVKVVDDHYQLDLPFLEDQPLSNNQTMTEKRLGSLKTCLKKDPDLHAKYKEGINEYVRKGFATKKRNHKQRACGIFLTTAKHRIVYDCAAQFDGVSLNKRFLQGLNMMNKLIGIIPTVPNSDVTFTNNF